MALILHPHRLTTVRRIAVALGLIVAIAAPAAGSTLQPEVSAGLLLDYAHFRLASSLGYGGGVGAYRPLGSRVGIFGAFDFSISQRGDNLIFVDQAPSGGGRRTLLMGVLGFRGYFTEWHYLMAGAGVEHVSYANLEFNPNFFDQSGDVPGGTGPVAQVGLGIDMFPTSVGNVFVDGRVTFGDVDPHGTAHTQFRLGFRFK